MLFVLLLLGSSAAVSPCSDGPWSIIGALEPPTFPKRRKALSLIRCCAGAVKVWRMFAFWLPSGGAAVTVWLLLFGSWKSDFSRNLLPSCGMNGANVGYKRDDRALLLMRKQGRVGRGCAKPLCWVVEIWVRDWQACGTLAVMWHDN